MKQIYKQAEIEFVFFDEADVITTSGLNEYIDDDQLPPRFDPKYVH